MTSRKGSAILADGTPVRLKSGSEGWIRGTVVEYFDVYSFGSLGSIYGGGMAPGYKVHILEGKHKGETIRVPTNYVELINEPMHGTVGTKVYKSAAEWRTRH